MEITQIKILFGRNTLTNEKIYGSALYSKPAIDWKYGLMWTFNYFSYGIEDNEKYYFRYL